MAKETARNDVERLERAEEYLAAAREHYAFLKRDAASNDEPSHYPLSYYMAGLAVECLFRAHAELVGSEHDAKHDLRRLAESGLFVRFMRDDEREEIAAALTAVSKRWLNNHRYRSVSGLRRYLSEPGLYKTEEGIYLRGNPQQVLRYNWERLFDRASYLLDRGIERWANSKQKWNPS